MATTVSPHTGCMVLAYLLVAMLVVPPDRILAQAGEDGSWLTTRSPRSCIAAEAPRGGPAKAWKLAIADGSDLFGGPPPVTDWSPFAELRFWVYVEGDEGTASVVTAVTTSVSPRPATHTASVPVGRWTEVRAPLRWFDGASSYTKVQEVVWRMPFGTSWFGGVQLAADSAYSSTLALDELVNTAYAGRPRVVSEGPVITVVAPQGSPDAAPLQALARTAFDALSAQTGIAGKSGEKPVLMLFPDLATFRSAVEACRSKWGGAVPPPQGDDWVANGAGFGVFQVGPGYARPVHKRTIASLWLERVAGLRADGSWFAEGLATLAQYGDGSRKEVVTLMRAIPQNEQLRKPLSTWATGQRVAIATTLQAMGLVQMLIEEPAYRSKLPNLIRKMAARPTSDLRPLAQPVFGKSLDTVEADWLAFLRKRYAADRAMAPPDAP